MLRNSFLLSVRNFRKNTASATINLVGLVLGLTSFAILYLYIEKEFSYDRMHERPDDIYRVVHDFVSNDGSRIPDAMSPPALAPALRSELANVQAVTRLFPNRGRTYLIQHNEREFYEMDVIRVDPYFFDVFNFPLISGSWDGGVTKNTILLTERMATKYFGNENPLDKVLRFNLNGGIDFVVKGVLKDIPSNSHFTFDFVIPFESTRNPDTNWNSGAYTYVKMKPGSDATELLSGTTRIFKEHQPNSLDEYHVQPLTDIHLQSHLKSEISSNGDLDYVKILVVITIFILFIAGINYINLTTANSVKRAKEVGVRKVTGAARSALVYQFVAESVIIAFVALGFSVILVGLLLPVAGQAIGEDFSQLMSESPTIKFVLPLCTLVFGLLSGLYPAIYISSFDPLKVLKGNFYHSRFGKYLRQGLVIFQFAISTVLIIGALTIYRQVMFMKEKELGFQKEHVMLLPNVRGGVGTTMKEGDKFEEMRQIPGVIDIARADGILGYSNSVNGVSVPGGGDQVSLNFLRVDYSFLPVMGMSLKDGRNFSEDFVSDSTAIVLNEAAVRQLGLQEPVIGQQVNWDDAVGITHRVTVIGVVKDFHFRSFREAIQPFGFTLEVNNGSTFFLKLDARDLSSTIEGIRKIWLDYNPDHPFAYQFQDEHIARFTLNEARFGKLFSFFTFLAIVIACLGLYGLVISVGEARTKEIGIRKVLGSSVFGILRLLSYDFVKLILIAFVLACPMAFMAMNYWLSAFAYKAVPGVGVFLMTGVFTIVIVVMTISFRTLRIAGANPTEALRSE